jgi:hypothetical protein
MRAIREVFFNAGVHLDRTANDLSRNFASRSIKMIPRGAGVGNIRRGGNEARSTFVARDESQERWKDGNAKDLWSRSCDRPQQIGEVATGADADDRRCDEFGSERCGQGLRSRGRARIIRAAPRLAQDLSYKQAEATITDGVEHSSSRKGAHDFKGRLNEGKRRD